MGTGNQLPHSFMLIVYLILCIPFALSFSKAFCFSSRSSFGGLFSLLLSHLNNKNNTVNKENRGMDLSNYTVGFVGCGKISSALARGYASMPDDTRPKKILVSRRNLEKSTALKQQHPLIVEVIENNSDLVTKADIIFLGILPGVARAELPKLPFRDDQLIISMMAAVDMKDLLVLFPSLSSTQNVVRTVPLPSAARRSGPILLYPQHANIESVLKCVGTPVVCLDENQMKPMVSITGHISSFFELMKTTQDFLVESGVDSALARQYVTSFYSSLALGAEISHEGLGEMRDEAATPGGLNEQVIFFFIGCGFMNTQHKYTGMKMHCFYVDCYPLK